MVRMVLDAEREQLENETQQLDGGVVLLRRPVARRVRQQRIH